MNFIEQGGRLFPSKIKTMSDTYKTLMPLYNHFLKCPYVPKTIQDNLEKLKRDHDEERKNKRYGSQKAFFSKVWERIHGEKPNN